MTVIGKKRKHRQDRAVQWSQERRPELFSIHLFVEHHRHVLFKIHANTAASVTQTVNNFTHKPNSNVQTVRWRMCNANCCDMLVTRKHSLEVSSNIFCTKTLTNKQLKQQCIPPSFHTKSGPVFLLPVFPVLHCKLFSQSNLTFTF